MVPGEDFAKSTDGEHSRLVVVASDGELSLMRTGNNLIARLAIQPAPAEDLVGVDPMRPRDPRHRCALDQRRFDDAPLQLDCPVLSLDCGPDLSLSCEDFCDLRGSVHLRSKWTHKWCPQRAKDALRLLLCPDGHCRTLTDILGRGNETAAESFLAAAFCFTLRVRYDGHYAGGDVPRQQPSIRENRMVGDAGQHLTEISFWVEAVELGRDRSGCKSRPRARRLNLILQIGNSSGPVQPRAGRVRRRCC